MQDMLRRIVSIHQKSSAVLVDVNIRGVQGDLNRLIHQMRVYRTQKT